VQGEDVGCRLELQLDGDRTALAPEVEVEGELNVVTAGPNVTGKPEIGAGIGGPGRGHQAALFLTPRVPASDERPVPA